MNTYFDNAATSFPKAPHLGNTLSTFIENSSVNINRGTYKNAYDLEEKVFETRELLSEYFGFEDYKNVVFTKNITESINLVINGLFDSNDHILISNFEHNALMRPLNHLNVEYSKIPCDSLGNFDMDLLKKSLKSNTKAIFVTHASNVTGTIMNIEQLSIFAHNNNLLFIIDAAQTAGLLKFKKNIADIICFTGHKHLLGPTGIGGFVGTKSILSQIKPFICGGTGSLSEQEIQPTYLPDKFESGTQNTLGIIGLNHSLNYINNKGIDTLENHQKELLKYFLNKLNYFENLNIHGTQSIDNKCPVVSISFKDSLDQGLFSYFLSDKYNISIRCGLHCAPSAHKTINTFPTGTMRFSLSPFHQKSDIDYVIDAISKGLKTL